MVVELGPVANVEVLVVLSQLLQQGGEICKQCALLRQVWVRVVMVTVDLVRVAVVVMVTVVAMDTLLSWLQWI